LEDRDLPCGLSRKRALLNNQMYQLFVPRESESRNPPQAAYLREKKCQLLEDRLSEDRGQSCDLWLRRLNQLFEVRDLEAKGQNNWKRRSWRRRRRRERDISPCSSRSPLLERQDTDLLQTGMQKSQEKSQGSYHLTLSDSPEGSPALAIFMPHYF
jgi:hypothetical protein